MKRAFFVVFYFVALFNLKAAVLITIFSPTSDTTTATNFITVEARITSEFELTSVTARVGTASTNLYWSASTQRWTNRLTFAPTWGTNILEVTAVNALDDIGQATRTFRYDEPVRLVINSPLSGTVARPDLLFDITATDDGPVPPVIEVTFPVYLRGTNFLHRVVKLTGRSRTLFARVSGVPGGVDRMVYFEPSLALREHFTYDGKLMDTDLERFLTIDNLWEKFPAGTPLARPMVFTLYSVSNRAAVQLWPNTNAYVTPNTGSLTPRGAILHYDQNKIVEYRDGVFEDLGAPSIKDYSLYSPLHFFKTKGQYAVYRDSRNETLVWYDVSNQQKQVITNDIVTAYELEANGRVLYAIHNILFTYQNGTSRAIYTNCCGITGIKTDGTNILYRTGELRLLTPTEDVVLMRTGDRLFDWHFQINNGWVTFVRTNNVGVNQVWRRSPSGVENQITFFNSNLSAIDGMGPNGEVVVYTVTNVSSFTPGVRSYTSPTVPLTALSAIFYQQPVNATRWFGTQPFIEIGRTFFKIVDGQLGNMTITNGNQLRFEAHGLPGRIQTLQWSENLTQWHDLITFTNSTNHFSYTDTNATTRFYRTVIKP